MLSLTLAAGDAGAAVALSLAVAIPRVAVPRPPVRAPLQLRRQELIVVMNRAQRRIVVVVALGRIPRALRLEFLRDATRRFGSPVRTTTDVSTTYQEPRRVGGVV